MKKIMLILSIFLITLSGFSEAILNESYFQTDIKEAISQLANDAQVTVIMDPNLAGFVTLEIANKPFSIALDMILTPFGYTWKLMPEGHYLVGVPDPSSGTSIHLNDTYVMKSRFLNSKNILQLLPKYLQKFVSISEQDQTLLVINAPPKIVGIIANNIKKIDMIRPEMTVEVKVVQIDNEKFKKWSLSNFEITEPYTKKDTNPNQHIALSDSGIDILGMLSGVNISFIVEKALASGQAQVVSNSKMTILSGSTGSLSGKIADSSLTSSAIPYTGFEMQLIPYLMTGKKVRLNLSVTLQDQRNITATNSLSQLLNKLSSEVVLSLDEEYSIASFNYSTSSEFEVGIPLISEIPGIGTLFKSKIKKEIEQQLIFLITCHVSGGDF